MAENRARSVVDILNKSKKVENVMLMGDNEIEEVARTPVGVLAFDRILGGGLPHGRIIELVGDPSSGKSTIALQCVAAVQKAGGVGVYLDMEYSLDPVYAQNLGVDVGNLIIQQPDSGEQAIETLRVLCENLKAGDIVIVDSVAAMVSEKELSADAGDALMGVQARMMGQAMRMLTGAVSKSGIILVFINQYRQKLGSMGPGEHKTTPGGMAISYYASIRVEVKKVGIVKTGEDAVGQKIKVKTIKNKTYPPFREFESEIRFGEGIPKILHIVDIAIDHGIITKSGSWLSYGDAKIGQGRDNAVNYLKDHEEVVEEIDRKIRAIFFPERTSS